jgi:hypothetical protein
LGPICYQSAPIRDINPALTGLLLKDIPKLDVKTPKNGLTQRINEIIADKFSNPIARYPVHWGADLVLGALVDWEFSRDIQGVSTAKIAATAPDTPTPLAPPRR